MEALFLRRFFDLIPMLLHFFFQQDLNKHFWCVFCLNTCQGHVYVRKTAFWWFPVIFCQRTIQKHTSSAHLIWITSTILAFKPFQLNRSIKCFYNSYLPHYSIWQLTPSFTFSRGVKYNSHILKLLQLEPTDNTEN